MIPIQEIPTDPGSMTPGAGGLAVFILLLVAAFVLYKSLRKQLNKVDFVEAPTKTPSDQPPAGS